MIIGNTLHGSDNDSFMIEDEEKLGSLACEKCGFLKNFDYHNPFFRLKRKSYDFSHPYDVGHIVSLRFKEFCVREGYRGLIFKEFEREPNFFQLVISNIVKIDTRKANTEFGKHCDVCCNFDYTVGFEPCHLVGISSELPDGLYRTDILFGSYNRKNPLVLVAPEAYHKMKKEKMKGLHFEPAYAG